MNTSDINSPENQAARTRALITEAGGRAHLPAAAAELAASFRDDKDHVARPERIALLMIRYKAPPCSQITDLFARLWGAAIAAGVGHAIIDGETIYGVFVKGDRDRLIADKWDERFQEVLDMAATRAGIDCDLFASAISRSSVFEDPDLHAFMQALVTSVSEVATVDAQIPDIG